MYAGLALVGFLLFFHGDQASCQQQSTTDGFVCYASTDCHGHVIPGGGSSKGDCCASDGSGLSFSESGDCSNCFNSEAFTSLGAEFYVAFPNNLEFMSSIISNANLRFKIATNEKDPVNVEVSTRTDEDQQYLTSLEQSAEVKVNIELKLSSITQRNKGIQIRSDSGVSIVALSEEFTSADMFLVLPPVYLPDQYVYYALSVDKEVNQTTHMSAILIVASEENTSITLTLSQSVNVSSAPDIEGSGVAGEPMFVTLEQMDTLYITSLENLSGSKVVANKPITFISGHECGDLPAGEDFCDQMFEQIPPTSTWGKEFYTAPLKSRQSYDIFRFVASEDTTTVTCVCSPPVITSILEIISAGDVASLNVSSNHSCSFTSNKPVLVVQFAVATSVDNMDADPFMMIVPPVEQYRNEYLVSTFQTESRTSESYFINIVINAAFDRDSVVLNGAAIAEPWTEILCEDVLQTPCAYGIQMDISISESAYVLSHKSGEPFGATVYSFGVRVGQGYVAGLNQEPVALDHVSFLDSSYEANEMDGMLEVILTLERSKNEFRDVSVRVRTTDLTTVDSAIEGIDYFAVDEEVIFSSDEMLKSVLIPFTDDDVLPEANKTFEVYLSASPGVLISPIAYVTATILNDDIPVPVNISFGVTNYSVSEGTGFVELVLSKTPGALAPVNVSLYTVDDSAVAGRDYESLNITIIFEEDDLMAKVRVKVIDNQKLQEMRTFTAVIEVTQTERFFPAQVQNGTATIEIKDDDMIIIGVNKATSEVIEGDDALVNVEVLFGSLEREVSVMLSTLDDSALGGQDYTPVNSSITFSESKTFEQVSISTNSDDSLEQAESFKVQVTYDHDDASVLLLPAQSTIVITDNNRVVIGLEVSAMTASESSGSIEAVVKVLSGVISTPVMVAFSTLSRTAIGDKDFESIQSTLVFDGDHLEHKVPIAIYDNSIRETVKTFSVQLSLISGVRTRLMPSAMNVIIEEDDAVNVMTCHFASDCRDTLNGTRFPAQSIDQCCSVLNGSSISFTAAGRTCQPCINIGFTQSEYIIRESVMNHTIPVRITGGRLPVATSVQVQAEGNTMDTPGPGDFNLYTSELFLTSDSFSSSITLEAVRDENTTDLMFEPFRLSLTHEPNVLPPNIILRRTVVTIEDVVPIIFFERSTYSVTEEEGSVAVTVSSNGEHLTPVNFIIGMTSDSAIDGMDYRVSMSSFTIMPDEESVTINVVVFSDTIVEAAEFFDLFIVNASVQGAVLDGTRFATQVQIRDSNVAIVGFDASSYTVHEDEGDVEVCVVVQQSVTIDFSFQLTLSAAPGSPVQGGDFPVVLLFDVGEQKECVTVQIVADSGVESFFVSLQVRGEPVGEIILRPSAALIVIIGGDIRFLPLGSASVSLPPDDDSISEAISPPGGFRAFGTNYSDLYVTSNGVITIGEASIECCPIRFDRIQVGASAFVAPYWIDNDPSIQGSVSYEVHAQGSTSLEDVNAFISRNLSIEFSGVWMLVAFWQNVPEIFFEEQINTYQGILITNGTKSYAVFVYNCDRLNPRSVAGIGYYFSSTQFEEHPLSNTNRSSRIACENLPSPWNSVVYELVCEDGQVRLVNGSNTAGRVEVCYKNLWGTVCDDDFGSAEATVVCRQLGLPSSSATGVGSARFGRGQGPISLGDVRCAGSESSLLSCAQVGEVGDCDHGKDAGVICDVEGCPVLPAPLFGSVRTTGRQPGDNATYQCNTGFELIGLETRVCREIDSGTVDWDGEEPVCRPLCDELDDPQFGSVSLSGVTIDSTATYQCDPGYNLVGLSTRTCMQISPDTADWDQEAPVCEPLCDELDDPQNGSVSLSGVTVDSTATYQCDPGFNLVGLSTRTCMQISPDTADWDQEAPVCEPVLCPPLRAPLNGTIELSGITVGSMASYSCDVGYELVGNTMRVCQSDGMWDGVVPQCRPLAISVSYEERRYNVIESREVTFSVCVITEDNEPSLRPFILNSATVDGTATAPNDYVTLNDFLSFNVGDSRMCHMITIVDDIICENSSESFFLSLTVGTSENITIRRPLTEVVISDEGEPECAQCPILINPPNGTVSVTGNSPGDTATYICGPNFDLVGNSTRVCGDDGQWSGEAPMCIPVMCPSLSDPLNGGVMWTNLSVGSVATYTCNSGFELVGNEMRTCQSDGVWSGEEPVCTACIEVNHSLIQEGLGEWLFINQVISNGVIFFDMAIEGFFPSEDTNFARIHEEYPDITPFLAPYWIDNDPSVAGLVSYEVFTGDSTQLNEVSEFISQSQCVQFTGTWMLVAEWDDVPPFSTDNETVNTTPQYLEQCERLSTYQGVVVTDGSSTYAVFIYLCGFIHENSTGAGIGYYINTTTFVEHPLSQTEMSPLIACENEASPWTNLIYPLASSVSTLQFLSVGDTVGVQRTFLPPFDNALSGDISPPSEGFPLFFSNARSINVHENGLIFFDGHTGVTAPQSINSIPFGSASFVAPYWVDNDPSSGGIISYEVHTASNPLLSQVSQYVSNYRGSQFCGTWMLVADWRDVPVFDESGTNSYQGVLITDGVNSYAVFIYECGQLAEGVVARIGYYISDGDGATALEHPFSGEMSSTIGCEVPNVVYNLTTLF